jgi:hypothetical protein
MDFFDPNTFPIHRALKLALSRMEHHVARSFRFHAWPVPRQFFNGHYLANLIEGTAVSRQQPKHGVEFREVEVIESEIEPDVVALHHPFDQL